MKKKPAYFSSNYNVSCYFEDYNRTCSERREIDQKNWYVKKKKVRCSNFLTWDKKSRYIRLINGLALCPGWSRQCLSMTWGRGPWHKCTSDHLVNLAVAPSTLWPLCLLKPQVGQSFKYFFSAKFFSWRHHRFLNY